MLGRTIRNRRRSGNLQPVGRPHDRAERNVRSASIVRSNKAHDRAGRNVRSASIVRSKQSARSRRAERSERVNRAFKQSARSRRAERSQRANHAVKTKRTIAPGGTSLAAPPRHADAGRHPRLFEELPEDVISTVLTPPPLTALKSTFDCYHREKRSRAAIPSLVRTVISARSDFSP
jgi:hypothetical protein